MSQTEILEERPKLTKAERFEIRLKLAELDGDGWLVRRSIDGRIEGSARRSSFQHGITSGEIDFMGRSKTTP